MKLNLKPLQRKQKCHNQSQISLVINWFTSSADSSVEIPKIFFFLLPKERQKGVLLHIIQFLAPTTKEMRRKKNKQLTTPEASKERKKRSEDNLKQQFSNNFSHLFLHILWEHRHVVNICLVLLLREPFWVIKFLPKYLWDYEMKFGNYWILSIKKISVYLKLSSVWTFKYFSVVTLNSSFGFLDKVSIW